MAARRQSRFSRACTSMASACATLHREVAAFANAASTDPASPFATTSALRHSHGAWQPVANPQPAPPTALGHATNNALAHPMALPTTAIGAGLKGISVAHESFTKAFATNGTDALPASRSAHSPALTNNSARFHPAEAGIPGGRVVPHASRLLPPPAPPPPPVAPAAAIRPGKPYVVRATPPTSPWLRLTEC